MKICHYWCFSESYYLATFFNRDEKEYKPYKFRNHYWSSSNYWFIRKFLKKDNQKFKKLMELKGGTDCKLNSNRHTEDTSATAWRNSWMPYVRWCTFLTNKLWLHPSQYSQQFTSNWEQILLGKSWLEIKNSCNTFMAPSKN